MHNSCLHELDEFKFPFVSRIEFLRSKVSHCSAHVSDVDDFPWTQYDGGGGGCIGLRLPHRQQQHLTMTEGGSCPY